MPATPTSTSEATAAALGRHLQAFGSGDVDAIMRDYAADAVLCTPDATFRGRDQIRAFFDQVMPLFPAAGTTLDLRRQDVNGEMAYVVWSASTPSVDVPLGSDTFVVRGDAIVYQSFAGHVLPKAG